MRRHAEVNTRVLEEFRRKIRDSGGGYSCRRYWVSLKYCAIGEGWENAR